MNKKDPTSYQCGVRSLFFIQQTRFLFRRRTWGSTRDHLQRIKADLPFFAVCFAVCFAVWFFLHCFRSSLHYCASIFSILSHRLTNLYDRNSTQGQFGLLYSVQTIWYPTINLLSVTIQVTVIPIQPFSIYAGQDVPVVERSSHKCSDSSLSINDVCVNSLYFRVTITFRSE